MEFVVKPAREPSRVYKAVEAVFFRFYQEGVLQENRAKRRIGVALGLLLHLMEEIPAGLKLLKLGYRQRKKALQTITKEEWEDAREKEREELEG